MIKAIIAILAILILVGAAALLLLWQPEEAGATEGSGWEAFLEDEGILMDNATAVSISAPENVTEHVVFLEVNESFMTPENETYVRTSFVYVDLETNGTMVAAYYVTSPDSEAERDRILGING